MIRSSRGHCRTDVSRGVPSDTRFAPGLADDCGVAPGLSNSGLVFLHRQSCDQRPMSTCFELYMEAYT
ncbi:hypothetical protein A0H81_03425 [Grifola frondosa]|uniref:Uncharacterized protein n=1 Tax=Grifola frondosa TaxID=5627 RepID=A0A1C7MPY5_GRIFR|nr:hypothetical protein A0H81_03425 [Grifola frondosa]